MRFETNNPLPIKDINRTRNKDGYFSVEDNGTRLTFCKASLAVARSDQMD
jgi:hypothetical protein